MATQRKHYTPERDAVRMMRNRGELTEARVADDLGGNANHLHGCAAKQETETVVRRNDERDSLEDENGRLGGVERTAADGEGHPTSRDLLRQGRRVDICHFIQTEEVNFEVRVVCAVSRVSLIAYDAWERWQESHHRRDSELLELTRTLFAQLRACYGAPCSHGGLAKAGDNVSRRRLLMPDAGIRAKVAEKHKATTDSKKALSVAPTLLERQFSAETGRDGWVRDMTYLRRRRD